MEAPARLQWRKEAEQYAAYPVGSIHPDRCATIRPNAAKHDSWVWAVGWAGWFSGGGFCESKQAAADAATEAWWRHINTDIPRDIDLEATMIVARLLVRPVPNGLFGEEPEFIRKVLWNIQNIYTEDIRRDTLPAPVENIMEQLSAEMARRRTTGEIPPPVITGPAAEGSYRRRRRR